MSATACAHAAMHRHAAYANAAPTTPRAKAPSAGAVPVDGDATNEPTRPATVTLANGIATTAASSTPVATGGAGAAARFGRINSIVSIAESDIQSR